MSTRARQLHPRVEAVLDYFGLREGEEAAERRVDWLALAFPALVGIAAGDAFDSAAPLGLGFVVSGLLAARATRRLRRDAASLRQGG